MVPQVEFSFTALNIDAVQIALGTSYPKGESLVNNITKQKGTRRYTVTTDKALSAVVEGALKALVYIKAIEYMNGPEEVVNG